MDYQESSKDEISSYSQNTAVTAIVVILIIVLICDAADAAVLVSTSS